MLRVRAVPSPKGFGGSDRQTYSYDSPFKTEAISDCRRLKSQAPPNAALMLYIGDACLRFNVLILGFLSSARTVDIFTSETVIRIYRATSRSCWIN